MGVNIFTPGGTGAIVIYPLRGLCRGQGAGVMEQGVAVSNPATPLAILMALSYQSSGGMISTCPGYIRSGSLSIGLFASKMILYLAAFPYTSLAIFDR